MGDAGAAGSAGGAGPVPAGRTAAAAARRDAAASAAGSSWAAATRGAAGAGAGPGPSSAVARAAAAAAVAAGAALPASGVAFEGPDGVIQHPPPLNSANIDAPPGPLPPAPPSPPPLPDPPGVVALRRDLLDQLDGHRSHSVSPDTGLLCSRARGGANAAPNPGADLLAHAAPPDSEYGAVATNAHADWRHRPAPYSPPTWQALLGGEARASLRDLVAVGGPTAGRGAAPQLWTAHPRGGPKISRSGPARE